MKKISHEERLKLSKERVQQRIKTDKKKMSAKTKKMINIGIITAGTVGLTTAAAFGIYSSVTAPKDQYYSYDKTGISAQDFKAGLDPAIKIDKEVNGAQTVISASKGPVKFTSNYYEIYNEEKVSDLLNWFYKDVSWGPEIASLSGISLMSGVQLEDGKVTLGYHTSSRAGSSIIISPDVNIEMSKTEHQKDIYAFTFMKAMQNSSDKASADKLLKRFVDASTANVDYSMLDKNVVYKFLARNNSLFEDLITNLMLQGAFWSSLKHKATIKDNDPNSEWNTNHPTEGDRPVAGIRDVIAHLKEFHKTHPASTHKNELIDEMSKSLPFSDRMNGVLDLELPDDLTPGETELLYQFYTSEEFRLLASRAAWDTYTNQNPFYMQLQSDDPIISLISPKVAWAPPADDTHQLWALFTKLGASDGIHFRTQWSTIRESGFMAEDRVKEILQSSLQEKLYKKLPTVKAKAVAMSDLALFYFNANQTMTQMLPGKKYGFATEVITSMYAEIMKMSLSEANKLTADWFYDFICNRDKVGEYTKKDIQILKQDVVNTQKILIELSKDLQKRRKPGGKTDQGKRIPGVPVYKEGDNGFDCIVRRANQSMLYTLSHEYGHHTTQWYAQDLSSFDDITDTIGASDVTSSANLSGKAFFSGEIKSGASLDQMQSAYKYALFKESFDSPYFRDVLDRASDGDSSTDISHLRYHAILPFGHLGDYNMLIDEFGIEMINSTKGQISSTFFGADEYDPDQMTPISGRTIEEELLSIYNATSDGSMKGPKELDTTFLEEFILKNVNSKFSNETFVDLKPLITKLLYNSLSSTGFMGADITVFTKTDSEIANANAGFMSGYLKEKAKYDAYLNTEQINAINAMLDVLKQEAKSSTPREFGELFFKELGEQYQYAFVTANKILSRKNWNFPKIGSNAGLLVKLYTKAKAMNATLYSSAADQTPIGLFAELLNFIEKKAGARKYSVKPTFTSSVHLEIEHSFEKYIYDLSKAKITSASNLPVNGTGELITSTFFQEAGKTSREVFDLMAGVTIQSKNIVGNEIVQQQSFQTRFNLYRYFVTYLKDHSTTNFADLKTELESGIQLDGNTLIFPSTIATQITNILKTGTSDGTGTQRGALLFDNLTQGTSSPAAVIYMFDKPGDTNLFKERFSTVIPGMASPQSFARYTATYAEALTRAWNQLAFIVDPELLAQPDAYYTEDALRFMAYGVKFFDVNTRELTPQAMAVKDMFIKYFNTDKTISTIIRSRGTGLYSFVGYSDDADYEKLVFTDENGDVKSAIDIIYDVDNLHYYDHHGTGNTFAETATYSQDLTARHSWMTEFSVFGNFSNSTLRAGTYHVSFWKDENGDGVIQKSELVKILNEEIQENGELNNNGQIDSTAQIVGNPDDVADPKGLFTIRVNDIRI